ncbi:hypothetical protein DXG03_004825 [Asterophora parasitica]|uniref:DUF6699 domain-containing protein n=1 Tax=Asterophora parasitica TaxID=117018 RepID=A0A9P7KA29_9AGAR|nr:hypothetical protein DXG03_004825 [Asterophora parasitica]
MSTQTLAQPACSLSTSRLVLISPKFPWPVVAISARKSQNPLRVSKTSSEKADSDVPLTVLDLLHAVHITLIARVTPEEWMSLGHGSRAQKQILQAYERRCVQAEGGWEEGVRRVDYLLGKTLLVGVEMYKTADKRDAVGRLVFSSP